MRTIIRTWEIHGHISLMVALSEAAELSRDLGSPTTHWIGIVARGAGETEFGVSRAQLVETLVAGVGRTFDLELLP